MFEAALFAHTIRFTIMHAGNEQLASDIACMHDNRECPDKHTPGWLPMNRMQTWAKSYPRQHH